MALDGDARRHVLIRLDTPPEVVSLGVGVHGVTRRRDVFRLPDMWQFHVYGYRAELIVDGVPHAIGPGYVSLVPPGVAVEYRYRGRSEHLYAHLRLPRVAGPRRGRPAVRRADGTMRVPTVQDGGAEIPQLTDLLQQAIAAWPSTPARAVAEVWSALWRVVQLGARSEAGRPHAAVATAIAYIEANLAGPLAVPDVARVAGVSHNHLTRLFRAQTGATVVAHIRRRRLERARHLLRESTLPIPTVAASVGIGDLQAFNKACRRELGASPRAVRAGRVG
jgi:AraC family transcriptional regulator